MPLPRPHRSAAPPFTALLFLALPFLALLSLTSTAFAEEPARGPATLERPATTTVAPEDALEHVGEERTVEFVVKGGRKLDDKEICFLNSNRDHRDSDTFTAVIFRAGLARFAADGIANPADEFLGQKLRVSGLVEKRNGQAQIVVESPTQIEVVEPDPAIRPAPQDR
jgi:hypothetical protein